MILAVSIENTYISFGVFADDKLIVDARLATRDSKSLDEYAILLSGILSMNNIPVDKIDGAVLASVVRPMNATIRGAIEKLCKVRPLLLGPGIKTGLSIKTDFPSQIGGDIVANAVAAADLMRPPYVVVDIGTATTLTAINIEGELSGVIICPGAASALQALSENAAELPRIAVESPRELLGKNTNDSMASGVVYGHAAMIDGLLQRISRQWGNRSLDIVATGEWAGQILPFSDYKDSLRVEPNLTLSGLHKIYRLNARKTLTKERI